MSESWLLVNAIVDDPTAPGSVINALAGVVRDDCRAGVVAAFVSHPNRSVARTTLQIEFDDDLQRALTRPGATARSRQATLAAATIDALRRCVSDHGQPDAVAYLDAHMPTGGGTDIAWAAAALATCPTAPREVIARALRLFVTAADPRINHLWLLPVAATFPQDLPELAAAADQHGLTQRAQELRQCAHAADPVLCAWDIVLPQSSSMHEYVTLTGDQAAARQMLASMSSAEGISTAAYSLCAAPTLRDTPTGWWALVASYTGKVLPVQDTPTSRRDAYAQIVARICDASDLERTGSLLADMDVDTQLAWVHQCANPDALSKYVRHALAALVADPSVHDQVRVAAKSTLDQHPSRWPRAAGAVESPTPQQVLTLPMSYVRRLAKRDPLLWTALVRALRPAVQARYAQLGDPLVLTALPTLEGVFDGTVGQLLDAAIHLTT